MPGPCSRTGHFAPRLDALAEQLLETTAGDRVTARIDLASKRLAVDRTAVEAHRRGVGYIANDSSLDQRALETIVWLEENRRPLVQPRFDVAPFPPTALIELYRVRAQMLGPIEREGRLVGWLSVHQLEERAWSPSDVAALEAACAQVSNELESTFEH